MRRSRFSRELGWVRVEGFEMLSVRLLGRMLFCYGEREWDFRGISLAGCGGGNSLRLPRSANSI